MSVQITAMLEDADGRCELCGGAIPQEDVNVEAFEASGLLICTDCLERTLDASAFDACSEVGMVGASRCWS